MQNKRNTLRKEILAQRDTLTTEQLHLKSLAVLEKVWQVEEFRKAATIFIYVNFRSEVETLPLISKCLAEKKRVAVPLTDKKNNRLIPYSISDPGQQLKPGYCGILEPDPLQAETIDPGEIDLIILPGSVFDAAGGRLGYGGGFYDRFLESAAPAAFRIGLAFEIQVVAAVPLLPHDQKLQALVTEKRIIKVSG
jgi:5-formyltetrahydrofolate cyclo-ligase